MPRTKTPPRRPKAEAPAAPTASPDVSKWEWVSRVAFVLILALVLTRATMQEFLRDSQEIIPGSEPVAREAGPATSLVLDLLAWVPAIMLLLRGCLDRRARVRFTLAHMLFLLLGAWAVLSTLWASDKFAAAISAFHFLSAGVLLWSASRLVTSWRRLRVVAGICAGLLLVHATKAAYYHYVEQPEMVEDFKQHRDDRLRGRGLEAGSFAAQQFEAKLLRGEMMGFNASPNSFAAVTVMLMVVTAGVVVQRKVNGDGVAWSAVPALGIAAGLCIIVWCDSKTAYATPVIAAGILGVLAIARGWLARRARLVYGAGMIAVLVAAAAIVGHGMHHGSLVISSMTFRWRYWVGAAGVFKSHPILGVGWENFGLSYLAKRLPIASEEVRDPHNFVVRFFSELGAIGGVLALAWVARLWWELTTRPMISVRAETVADETPPRRAVPTAAMVTAAALVLSILSYVDFAFIGVGGDAGPALVILRLLERSALAIVLFVGIFTTITRSLERPVVDDRPAPWILYAILTGLGVFLLHNLVDFSLFEVGPMFLFALLAGSAMGMRSGGSGGGGAEEAGRSSRNVSIAGLAIACAAWLGFAVGLVLPVLSAEGHAADGDEALRQSRAPQAAQAYAAAAESVPYNAEYHLSEARMYHAMHDVERARRAYDAAAAANPLGAQYRLARAGLEASLPNPDVSRIRADYDAAIALDPASVSGRLAYAELLERLGFPADARAQYEKALWFNDELPPDEVKRLPPARVAEIRAKIAQLGR